MAKLTTAERKNLAPGQFAGPGDTFPIEDKVHAEKALQLAPRSEKAGNITPAEEKDIQGKARAKLASIKGATKRSPKLNKATVI